MSIWTIGMIVIGAGAAIAFLRSSDGTDKAIYGMMFFMAWMWPLGLILWIFKKRQ
ncbi:MAG: hypothetical protein HOJ88_10640 [Proteobacteria bacterium]|nr:hypothetical protein [Pseudomonadota bacterium]